MKLSYFSLSTLPLIIVLSVFFSASASTPVKAASVDQVLTKVKSLDILPTNKKDELEPTPLPEPTVVPTAIPTPIPTPVPTPVSTPVPTPEAPKTTTQQQGTVHTPIQPIVIINTVTPTPNPVNKSTPSPTPKVAGIVKTTPQPPTTEKTTILASVPAPKAGPNPLDSFMDNLKPSYLYVGDSFTPAATRNLSATALLLGIVGILFLISGYKFRR